MYYHEEIINGVLSYRNIPDGAWHPLTPEQLTARIIELKAKVFSLECEVEETLERVSEEA